jgi:hypothetical protein
VRLWNGYRWLEYSDRDDSAVDEEQPPPSSAPMASAVDPAVGVDGLNEHRRTLERVLMLPAGWAGGGE